MYWEGGVVVGREAVVGAVEGGAQDVVQALVLRARGAAARKAVPHDSNTMVEAACGRVNPQAKTPQAKNLRV